MGRIEPSRSEAPEGVQRNSPELATERQGLLAGVQDEASNKPVSEVACEVAQPGEVFRPNGRAGFHLDSDRSPVWCLDDRIDFDLVFGAVVVQPAAFVGPG